MSNLIPVEHQHQRILTTEQLAEVYQTESRRITENFQRNQARFVLGKHYHLLEGDELREFKHEYAESVVAPNVNKLYLWTERGASRHCKILDTDKAWEQFDNLEETYFNPKRKSLPQLSLPKIVKNVKARMELLLLSGMSKQRAYSKALISEEILLGVDLSEFKPVPRVVTSTGKHSSREIDITPILEAIHAVISSRSGIHRDFGGGTYALNRDSVYRELDARGLPHRESLGALCSAGILERGGVHFTRTIRLRVGCRVRAVFVRLDEEVDRVKTVGLLNQRRR